MRKRFFNGAQITNGRNVWNVWGVWDREANRITVMEVAGDISDLPGIAQALSQRYPQCAWSYTGRGDSNGKH